jgi:hypothetical protein
MKPSELRALRAGAQLLAGEQAKTAEQVVRRLLAVQTQDLGAGLLSLRARVAKLTIPEAHQAINDRAVVVTWVNRGTIHMLSPDDLPWLLALTAPTLRTGVLRRLTLDGVSEANARKAIDVIVTALADEGPLKREDLRARVKQAGLEAEGQALVHLLFRASYEGLIVRGPIAGRQHLFARTEDWLGRQPKPPPRDQALAELARRYLAGFGPATAADLAYWAGLPLRDARAGLAAIATEPAGAGELVDLDARRGDPPAPVPPRLLGAFDPYLLGWRDRAFAVEEAHARRVHPGGGMLRAVALLDGAAAGTWSARRRSGGRLEITIEPFAPLKPEAFDAERADVERFESVS